MADQRENVDVYVELHDALSRPAGRAEEAIEDLGDEVLQLAAKEEVATQETNRLERALNALARAAGRADRSGKDTAKSTKALDANAKAASAGGVKALGKVFKALKLPVILSLLGAVAGGLSALGAGAYAGVAGLAPLVGLLGAMPALLGALIGGFAAVKLGFGGIGEALKIVGDSEKSVEEQAAALAKLSPAAQSFVLTLADLKEGTLGWRDSIQAAMLPKFEQTLLRLKPLMPIIARGLESNAAAMGDLALATGDVVAGRGGDLTKVFRSNERIIRNGMTPALVAFVGIFLDFMVAGSPLANRFATWLGESATAIADMVSEGRKTGKLQDFLERAGDLGAAVGAVFGDIAVALFNIGRESGALSSMMGKGIQDVIHDWRVWTESLQGRNAIRDWFEGAAPLLREVGRMLAILGQGFLNLATDGSMTAIFAQINDRILPALFDLADTANTALIPALLTLLEVFINFNTALGQSPIPELLLGVATAAKFVVDVFGMLPGPVRLAVAALLALRLMSKLTAGPLALLAAQGPKMRTTFGDMRAGAQLYSEGLRGIPRAAGAARGAIAGLRGAGGGLMAAMGGPWGLAIAGATALLGLWMKKQQEAKAKVDEVKASLDEQTGAITDNTRATINKNLEEAGAFEAADKLGIAYSTVTDAAMGNTEAQALLDAQLQAQIDSMAELNNRLGADAETRANFQNATNDLTSAIGDNKAILDETLPSAKRLAEANQAGAVQANTLKVATDRATAGTDRFSNMTDRSAASAREAAAANEKNRQSLIALNDTLVSQQRTLIGFRQNIADARKALQDNKKTMDLHTQAGRDNRSALLDVAEAASAVENKAQRVQAIKEARKFITQWGDAAGWSKDRAKEYADQLFNLGEKARNLPPKANVDVSVTGTETVLGRLRDIDAYADQLANRTIHMDVRLNGGPRKDGGPVVPGLQYTVGEVGPELFIGASGNVGVIGAGGQQTKEFSEVGYVLPHEYYEAAKADRPMAMAGPPAPTNQGSSSGDDSPVPPIHQHFHGDRGNLTTAEIEAAAMRAYRRHEREKRERR